MYRYLKLVGAILLLVSLALPMASCTRFEDEEGNRVEVVDGDPHPEGIKEVVTYNYALENFDPTEISSWAVLLTFVWPIIIVGILFWLKRGRIVVVLRILEPLLVIGSFYMVYWISSFLVTRREWGAYLAFLALGVYGIGFLWEDLILYRGWRQAQRGTTHPR